jgi:hypothetical protein
MGEEEVSKPPVQVPPWIIWIVFGLGIGGTANEGISLVRGGDIDKDAVRTIVREELERDRQYHDSRNEDIIRRLERLERASEQRQ